MPRATGVEQLCPLRQESRVVMLSGPVGLLSSTDVDPEGFFPGLLDCWLQLTSTCEPWTGEPEDKSCGKN